MKFLFRIGFVATLFLLCGLSTSSETCVSSVTRFYGLSGLEESIQYGSIKDSLSKDYCPHIGESCCSQEDFVTSAGLWKTKVNQIRDYSTHIFNVFQKIAITQASLGDILGRIPSAQKQTSFCRDLDPLYFSKAIRFNEIYISLKNALEAFAFIQKGFYCSVCDAYNHQFMTSANGINTLSLNRNSCANLIFYFKEYIAYKIFYFDPLIINLNFLSNCLGKNSDKMFKPKYTTSYENIKSCVLNNANCDSVCREFQIGSSNPLFIGDLEQYEEVLETMQNLIENFGDGAQDLPTRPPTTSKFFNVDEGSDQFQEGDLSTFSIEIKENGLDIFSNAEYSAFELNVINNFEGEDTEEENIIGDRTSKVNMEDMQFDSTLPSNAEISMLENESKDLDQQAIVNLQYGKIETTEVETDFYGKGANKISSTETKTAKIVSVLFVFLLWLLF